MATTTIYEICKDIRVSGEAKKAHKASPSIVEGRSVGKPPLKEGRLQLTPEQLLGVYVERLRLEGDVKGYQRPAVSVSRCRRIAASLTRGEGVEPPSLGLDSGKVFAADGQHRIIGGVIAWRPLWCVIEEMTQAERAQRFANQRLAVRPPGDVLALAGDDPIARYIKAAIVAEAAGQEQPLAGIVGFRTNDTHLGAGIVYEQLAAYVFNVVGGSGAAKLASGLPAAEFRKRFSTSIADEYAILLRSFGNKKMAHPVSFRPSTLRALNDLAVVAIRRSSKREQDILRWQRHMPSFDWTSASWATRSDEMRPLLVAHWNKRLPEQRKVKF